MEDSASCADGNHRLHRHHAHHCLSNNSTCDSEVANDNDAPVPRALELQHRVNGGGGCVMLDCSMTPMNLSSHGDVVSMCHHVIIIRFTSMFRSKPGMNLGRSVSTTFSGPRRATASPTNPVPEPAAAMFLLQSFSVYPGATKPDTRRQPWLKSFAIMSSGIHMASVTPLGCPLDTQARRQHA